MSYVKFVFYATLTNQPDMDGNMIIEATRYPSNISMEGITTAKRNTLLNFLWRIFLKCLILLHLIHNTLRTINR